MSTIDLTKVAGFKAVDAEGNDMGIVSLSEMTNMVKESIIQEAVAMQSVSTLAETSTRAATDTYEDRLPTSDTFSYVRTLDSSGNPKRTSQNALATVVGGLLNSKGIIGTFSSVFNGNFSDFSQWKYAGIYRYSISTDSTGVIDGPYGKENLYGALEVLVRGDYGISTNIIVQKFYSASYGTIKIRTCKCLGGIWTNGEWKEVYAKY